MNVQTFSAESAADAVAQIRATLGPEAVVLDVRPLPRNGLARLWQKPRIEVLACVSQEAGALNQRLAAAPIAVEEPSPPESAKTKAAFATNLPEFEEPQSATSFPSRWRIGGMLAKAGISPVHVQQVVDALIERHGENPPESLNKELALTRALLGDLWARRSKLRPPKKFHVLVGAPGVGKSTLLSKWLAHTILIDGKSARVWRLDGRQANTAEALSVYGEILGVPVERRWSAADAGCLEDTEFVDLPGVDWTDAAALEQVRQQIESLPSPEVHLVLNAAYETSLLMAQARAFSVLPIEEISFTHLDEEPRGGKLWNVILGTNYTVRFLSGGQNVPGNFAEASATMLLDRFIPCK